MEEENNKDYPDLKAVQLLYETVREYPSGYDSEDLLELLSESEHILSTLEQVKTKTTNRQLIQRSILDIYDKLSEAVDITIGRRISRDMWYGRSSTIHDLLKYATKYDIVIGCIDYESFCVAEEDTEDDIKTFPKEELNGMYEMHKTIDLITALEKDKDPSIGQYLLYERVFDLEICRLVSKRDKDKINRKLKKMYPYFYQIKKKQLDKIKRRSRGHVTDEIIKTVMDCYRDDDCIEVVQHYLYIKHGYDISLKKIKKIIDKQKSQ